MPKRRADWLIGRVAAKVAVRRALAQALPGDWPLPIIELRSAPGGRPYAVVAPEAGPGARLAPGARLPVAVSISHLGGRALGAASWDGGEDGAPSLGIDLGLVEPRSLELMATFFTDDERRFVRGGAASGRDLRANLVWCAKEAVLKALGVGLTVDTWGLTCLPDPGVADGPSPRPTPDAEAWSPFLASCAPSLVAGGETIRGVWRTFPGGLVGALATRWGARDRVAVGGGGLARGLGRGCAPEDPASAVVCPG